MNKAVDWYQKKIGAYDLLIWEKAVEIQEQNCNGMRVRNKQESHLKPEFIDVDLVRGSTFSKTKPQHNVVVLLSIGILRVLFLPLFCKWWIQQSSCYIFCGLLFLYFSQILCIGLYYTMAYDDLCSIPVGEIALPCLMLIVLGIVHSQVVSTNYIIPYNGKRSTHLKLLKKRTLSTALLEPAEGGHCKQMLSFVKTKVKQFDNDLDQADRGETESLPKNADCTNSSQNYCASPEFDEDPFWENIQEETCEFSSDDGSEASNASNACAKDSYKVQPMHTFSSDYYVLGVVFSVLISLLPLIYRLFQQKKLEDIVESPASAIAIVLGENNINMTIVVALVFLQRLFITAMFFVMLCTAQQTFRKRLLYSKYFTHLTSSRRAKKSLLPHFRLNKVQNIRVWLTLRSYLRRRGPQRSVDVIVSSAFLCFICLLCFVTVQLMHSSDLFVSSLMCCDCVVLMLALALFILHFITTGVKINEKYSCISILLTEQINLHLQTERKPHKKEQLQRANNVLTLAAKLIKEIEEPFNIYGLAMNPILYNITRVVLLSAFSGVLSEMLGFKLKIWKIKT
ncbi:protein PHTF2-like isoform X2 [Clavelina lepadiformis]|uniref:PHTF1/2 N-terminal domain-containing protein n=1 Tax=Clavelina lepadiformis TaxID=159417 RepID=A0ABP0GXI2_CLALP